MIQDILETLQNNRNIDALIVSIPSVKVQAVVQLAIDSGMPVFGVNSGYDVDLPGLLGHVAMDDKLGGKEAAEVFLNRWENNTNPKRVLFINHEEGNAALDLRREGLTETLLEQNAGHTVQIVTVDPSRSDLQQLLNSALFSCLYDGVMMAGSARLEEVIASYYKNNCSFDKMLLGTFDTRSEVYDAIALSKIAFTISQQQYLQGSLSVLMAAMFATTGKSLLPKSTEAPFGNYLTGPKVITRNTLPTDTQQLCESESFPVCNGDGESFTSWLGNRCKCTDRRQIRIGSVLIDPSPGFWEPVWEGAYQAAQDMGVQLTVDSIDRSEGFTSESARLAAKVRSLCQDGVDGIFTTITSQDMFGAIQFCQELNVPVVTVNSGAAFADQLGLPQHISMQDYDAGYAAGKAMINAGMKMPLTMQQEAVRVGVTAPSNLNVLIFRQDLEENIMQGGDEWDQVGILLCSDFFVEAALFTKESHPKVLLGVFDEGSLVYEYIDKGLIMFGIDQLPYLQGYLPVPLLTWYAHTRQVLASHYLETGPKLVTKSPSGEEMDCIAINFVSCPEPLNKNQLGTVRPVGLTLTAVVFATAVGFVAWVVWHRKARVVKESQPLFLVTICIGTVFMATTIIPLSLDDEVLGEDGGCIGCDCKSCDVACMSAPWIFALGFSAVFASLFSKMWRLNRVAGRVGRFRRVKVSILDVLIPFSALLGLNAVFMLVWTSVDPMYWTRTSRCGSDDFTSYGSCLIGNNPTSIAMVSCVVAINFLAIILANYEAFRARRYTTEFGERKYIALAMASILQIMMVGIPLFFLVKEDPPAQFCVQAGIITIVCLSVLLLIFVPKIIITHRKSGDASDGVAIPDSMRSRWSMKSNGNTVDGSVGRSSSLRSRHGPTTASAEMLSSICEKSVSKFDQDSVRFHEGEDFFEPSTDTIVASNQGKDNHEGNEEEEG